MGKKTNLIKDAQRIIDHLREDSKTRTWPKPSIWEISAWWDDAQNAVGTIPPPAAPKTAEQLAEDRDHHAKVEAYLFARAVENFKKEIDSQRPPDLPEDAECLPSGPTSISSPTSAGPPTPPRHPPAHRPFHSEEKGAGDQA